MRWKEGDQVKRPQQGVVEVGTFILGVLHKWEVREVSSVLN